MQNKASIAANATQHEISQETAKRLRQEDKAGKQLERVQTQMAEWVQPLVMENTTLLLGWIAVAKARAIAEDIRAKHPDLKVAITGISMMNNAFMEAGMQDSATLTPLMYLILIVVMVVTLRSFSATISTIFAKAP